MLDSYMVNEVPYGIPIVTMGGFSKLPFGHYLACNPPEIGRVYPLVLAERLNRYLLVPEELLQKQVRRVAWINFILFCHR